MPWARLLGRPILLLVWVTAASACSAGVRPGPERPPSRGAPSGPAVAVDLEGSFLWLLDDLSLRSPGGGRVHLASEGGELAAVDIAPDGRFRIWAQLPPGRVTLRFVQLGFDIQERTLLITGDLSARLVPVCTADALGPPGEPIALPALALLDEPAESRCDYPLIDTVRPYDFRIRRDALSTP